MSAIFSFPDAFFSRSEKKEFYRDDIEEFIDEYSFSDEKLKVYQKSKKIGNIIDTVGNISLLVFFVSLLTVVIFPIYSIGAGLLFDRVTIPPYLSRFIADRPTVQTSTLVFIGTVLLSALFISLLAFRISRTFENYADDTGIDSDAIEFRKIAKACLAFEDDDYDSTIRHLEEFDSFYGRRYISEYVDSAKSQGRVDTDYIEETFEEFVGLFVEYTHSSSTDERAMVMSSIVNRESDYKVEQEPEFEEEREEGFKDTYIGIIGAVFARLISGIPRQIYSVLFGRPIVVYVGLLLVGVALIEVDATLALVVVTVLIAGFDTWRRNKKTDSGEGQPSD